MNRFILILKFLWYIYVNIHEHIDKTYMTLLYKVCNTGIPFYWRKIGGSGCFSVILVGYFVFSLPAYYFILHPLCNQPEGKKSTHTAHHRHIHTHVKVERERDMQKGWTEREKRVELSLRRIQVERKREQQQKIVFTFYGAICLSAFSRTYATTYKRRILSWWIILFHVCSPSLPCSITTTIVIASPIMPVVGFI